MSRTTSPGSALSQCYASNVAHVTQNSQDEPSTASAKPSEEQQRKKKKTQAELDKELQLKMQGLSGDGGESGVEYEDGQPVSMKRSVKNNMFRYI
ncbi:hypothetical protein K458DRAFT_382788 [Lentithecium fluviatile CBS 122367]|uniref:Uncharacterized protein n=1 Tax=Lentithecium fluviatile CBS 122367 TaxID=1168545 RepID=A0A6G1JKX1_9PLEO|nr:hypothetical protein K458DRAFT_382788 [Lentithecium fluviatile CBS 122367]